MGNYSTPGGQNADILRATINGESYGEPPTSEISELLIELNELLITNRPVLQYAKNVQYTSDASGNIVLANSIDNVVIVSVRVRGDATWTMGYNDLAGYYIHLMDYSGQVLPSTTVNLDIVYYSYDWTAA